MKRFKPKANLGKTDMVNGSFHWVFSSVAALSFLSLPLFGQDSLNQRAATLEGTPGLFLTWDAEPLRPGEVFFSSGVLRNHRDPGAITMTSADVGLAIGILPRLEIFGMGEAQKRVQADGINAYRFLPGGVPQPAETPTGERLFTMAAPFITVPVGTGHGDVYGNIKYNFLSESAGKPFSLSALAVGKLPGVKSFSALNRGLTTGDKEVGFATIASKRIRDLAQFHVNALWSFTADPVVEGVAISDIHHRFLFRAGSGIRVSQPLQVIGEFQVYDYFGHHVPGLDPTSPVDIIVGLRAFANRFVNLGGAYVASVNHIQEDASKGVRPAGTNGFIFQFGLTFRQEKLAK